MMFIESEWHALNVDDHKEYLINDTTIFKTENTIITFQSSDLVRYLSTIKTVKSLPDIVNLICFDKQMSQEGKEFRDFTKWKAFSFLKHHKIVDSEFELTKSNFPLFLEHLAKVYFILLEKDTSEKKRFETVEMKVNRIIHQTQKKGVRIDLGIANQKCIELEKKIYEIKNILQLDHKIYSPCNISQQISYLNSKRYNINQGPKYSFKARRNEDIVSNLFYELIRTEKDLDSYLHILSHWGGSERTFPTFYGFGSTTGRITMRQPSIQNLRKNNRSVLVPDIGMKFLYVDYSQFEAGILASLSGDEILISLYNTDIYSDLGEHVLGDKNNRSEAKIIFYRYMYGDTTLNKMARMYFQKFKKLNEFIANIQSMIKKEKKVGTILGNHRYSMDENGSWHLSHIVQGTASLIYKNSLVKTNELVKSAEFLIPMHDGTLYQIPSLNYDVSKEKIERIYKSEFKEICPRIEPRLNVSDLF